MEISVSLAGMDRRLGNGRGKLDWIGRDGTGRSVNEKEGVEKRGRVQYLRPISLLPKVLECYLEFVTVGVGQPSTSITDDNFQQAGKMAAGDWRV
ncbi:hypothetical protein TNCV_4272961 [Trichonephila clavipes]|nr:hypothetical protein TNCV_4272961 [Trichonephila clavipes]